MEVFASPVAVNKARKRSRNPEKWKVNRAKQERYGPKNLPNLSVKCSHNTSKKFKCTELTPQDIRKFHEAFYAQREKFYQDAFILKHLKVTVPRQNNTDVRRRQTSKTYTKLFVKRHSGGKLVRVCQKFFLKVLSVGVHRLRTISKKYLSDGRLPVEGRGGDRKSRKNADKKKAVMNFIESLQCIESHYCRSATSTRMYVASELNIKKLWRMYENKQEIEALKVRHCYFRTIFNTHYNIGFKMPSVDVCSKCLSYREKIKNEKNSSIKGNLIGELRLHKLKAKSFFEYLREYNDSTLTLSFDCQKNQVLPRVPDQSAYYSRQIYQYNFAIVKGNAIQNIARDNVFLYTWTENTHAKGANEISSAVYHRLCNSDLRNITKVRLMCDGCSSQNKNSILLAMCAYWLATKAPGSVKTIEIIYPVPGHSFMPADRVFGLIENEIKKIGIIILPKQYDEIFNKFGNVLELGHNCPVYDWKTAKTTILKDSSQYHFKFNTCKRFYIKRVKNDTERFLIRGEVNYRVDLGAFKSIMKNKRCKLSHMNPGLILPSKVNIKPLKKIDVDKLLGKHYGVNWRTEFSELLSFYINVIRTEEVPDNANQSQEVPEADDRNELCEYYPEEIGFSI